MSRPRCRASGPPSAGGSRSTSSRLCRSWPSSRISRGILGDRGLPPAIGDDLEQRHERGRRRDDDALLERGIDAGRDARPAPPTGTDRPAGTTPRIPGCLRTAPSSSSGRARARAVPRAARGARARRGAHRRPAPRRRPCRHRAESSHRRRCSRASGMRTSRSGRSDPFAGLHLCLFGEIAVLGHAGQLDDAPQREFAPAAAHFRAPQCRGEIARLALQERLHVHEALDLPGEFAGGLARSRSSPAPGSSCCAQRQFRRVRPVA